MDWVPYVIFVMGMMDAGLIMVGGLILAGLCLLGKELEQFWTRLAPATGILIGSNIAAAVVLGLTRYFVS